MFVNRKMILDLVLVERSIGFKDLDFLTAMSTSTAGARRG